MGDKTTGRAGAGVIVAICFFIAALEGYDIQAFGVAAPRFAPELGLDSGQLGWAGSAAMIGLVIGAFVGGLLADKVGRKPVLVVSTALFGVFSVVTAMSHGYDHMLLARFATGLGFGGAMPNLIAIATEISAPNRRAATVTTIFCGMPAGGAAVALLARYGGDAVDWRMMFLIGGALPLLLTPVIIFLLPETRPVQDKAADRNLFRALFGQGRAIPTLLLWAVFMMTLVVLYLLLNWLPTLVIAKGLAASDGASAAFVFNISSIIGALFLGFVVDRVGFRWPLLIVYLALAAALYGLGGASALTPLLALSGAAGFLVIGAQYALYALAPVYYAPQVRAAGAGAAVAVGRFGSILGPLLAGELRAAGYSADQVFGALLPVVALAGLAAFALTSIGKAYRTDATGTSPLARSGALGLPADREHP
ncbi:3-(3-hydroxy-phenyl)propionate transporter MhpT [Phenylobacterium sp.]|uniref:3-(3-hydroxy-phenyl)propionate transporter MhpT n=1 Tax=Phenylobacterium sp. TaxID=1871053 RepID=UPI0030F4113A